jgi:curved DNA-binding protein CbpA
MECWKDTPGKIKMDIRRCFEILELDHDASPDEAKQAYKDIVNVWHPDRFSQNLRLRHKAEEKLKEANLAYETVKSFLSSRQGVEPQQERASQAGAGSEAEQNKAEARDKTEAAVEAGTRIILSVWSYLSTKLRRIVDSQVQAFKAELEAKEKPGGLDQEQRQSRGRGREKGKGRGMGRD